MEAKHCECQTLYLIINDQTFLLELHFKVDVLPTTVCGEIQLGTLTQPMHNCPTFSCYTERNVNQCILNGSVSQTFSWYTGRNVNACILNGSVSQTIFMLREREREIYHISKGTSTKLFLED